MKTLAHGYDPFCHCQECCKHELTLTIQIRSEVISKYSSRATKQYAIK